MKIKFASSFYSTLFAPLLLILATACSPSINPQLKAGVDGRLAMIQDSSESYAADSLPVGYQAGQWLQYKMLDDKGHPSIMTYKLIAEIDGGFAIETVSESYYATSASYMEIRYAIGAPPSSIQVLRVVSSDNNGTPTEMDSMSLSLMDSMYKKLAGQLFYTQLPGPSGASVSVPAGAFASCSEMDSTLSFGPWTFTSHSWHHPAVPMHGMVKSERTDGKPGSSELIAFGHSGAESEVLGRM
tara:strand:+ start:8350 stop:9075 length:726 start_codon:yes stop_codon:yes gene_type:complete